MHRWHTRFLRKVLSMTKNNYTYILECSDGTYYCGWTNDLEKRLSAHNNGTASKYTRIRRPVKLVYYETFETKQEAMSREYHIKQLKRKEKESLIKQLLLDKVNPFPKLSK